MKKLSSKYTCGLLRVGCDVNYRKRSQCFFFVLFQSLLYQACIFFPWLRSTTLRTHTRKLLALSTKRDVTHLVGYLPTYYKTNALVNILFFWVLVLLFQQEMSGVWYSSTWLFVKHSEVHTQDRSGGHLQFKSS